MGRPVNKTRARAITNKALCKGKIEKLPCEVCGSEKVEGHHLDYSKPLLIMWLCRRHHRAWHKKFGYLKGKNYPTHKGLLVTAKTHYRVALKARRRGQTIDKFISNLLKPCK